MRSRSRSSIGPSLVDCSNEGIRASVATIPILHRSVLPVRPVSLPLAPLIQGVWRYQHQSPEPRYQD